MSSGTTSGTGPRRFLVAMNGDLINVDRVNLITIQNGKVIANMLTGPVVELAVTPEQMPEFRRLLGITLVTP